MSEPFNEPAFPHTIANPGKDSFVDMFGTDIPYGKECRYTGMSLRDYFAAKALGGLINYSPEPDEHSNIAHLCYALADAMLKARQK